MDAPSTITTVDPQTAPPVREDRPLMGIGLRLAGLAAEREELIRLSRRRVIDEATARKLIREIDLQEIRYA